MMQPPDLPRIDIHRCTKACEGNAYAGQIVYLIHHWHALSRHVEGDKRWVKTTLAKMSERTGIPRWRVKKRCNG